MGGGKGGTTTTSVDIPDSLRHLFNQTAANVGHQQGVNPLTYYTGGGNAFRSADRAPQFDWAGNAINRSGRVAGEQLASRAALNARPQDINYGIWAAQDSARGAGRVPGQYADLRPTASERVGLSQLEHQAASRSAELAEAAGEVPGTFAEVRQQADPRLADLTQLADTRVTGANIQDSPSYQAAIQAFESAIMPTIQNQAALSGLGRSTGLTQSLAAGQSQYLLPVIQEELAREERGIERGLGARQFGIQTAADLGLQQALAEERGIGRSQDAGQFAAGLTAALGGEEAARRERTIDRELAAIMGQGAAEERGIERQLGADQFLSNQYFGAGQMDLQRQLEALGADERARALRYDQSQQEIGQLMQLGQLEQDYQQGRLDRQTQDYLRRQALAEQAVYAPFGGFVPSTFGQTASTSGKK